MLTYNLHPHVEAFSTHANDAPDFSVILPAHQAHSTRSAVVDSNGPLEDTVGVDALITRTPDVRIGVKTADCVPILLFDPVTKTAAAVHSGWKGTLANITGVVIERLRVQFNVNPNSLHALIGPCIHQEAFEVGDELYEAFSKAGYGDFCRTMPRFGTDTDIKWHIDLPGICHRQLRSEGVSVIEIRPECTYTLFPTFHSARRLGKRFDRQRILNCIMIKA